ncbi:MAG: hypothetical protein ACFE9L_12775 [Candidatus Hodarchaeota archaeon]
MGFLEFLLLTLPLLATAGLSFMNFVVFLRNYFQKEESTLFHVALVFLFASLIFVLLSFARFIDTSFPLGIFLICHVVSWVIFLEIANSYFSAFLNRSRAAERYVLPIIGASIGLSLLGAFNPNFYLLAIPWGIETGIYLAGIASMLYILIMGYNRINLLLGQFEGEELRLLNFTKIILGLGVVSISFTFCSVIGWLLIQDISTLSLEIADWQLIDWVVYCNIPLYIMILLGALIQFSKLQFDKIDIPTVLNILDSPQE